MLTANHIITSRLLNQQLATTKFATPAEIVSWLGAMQAQDFAMAKWAIGLRIPGLYDADVEKAFNTGEILRTHVLRPTWHFVPPADIRWMLELTAPRVNALSAYYYRAAGLDNKVFKKTNTVIAKALQGNNHFTRAALQKILAKAKVNAEGLRLTYIMMRAELDAVICSGPRQGKQFTYALLDERVPGAKSLHRQDALAELTGRYFTSRGPATLNDYATWSGLAMKDAKDGVNMLEKQLAKEKLGDKEYFFDASAQPLQNKLDAKMQSTFLLPDYDEYAISYKDRSILFGERDSKTNTKAENPVFYHTIIVDGVAAGTWKKIPAGKLVDVEITLTKELSKAKQQAVAKAVKKYLQFVNAKAK
jgi:hypothetical protein